MSMISFVLEIVEFWVPSSKISTFYKFGTWLNSRFSLVCQFRASISFCAMVEKPLMVPKTI